MTSRGVAMLQQGLHGMEATQRAWSPKAMLDDNDHPVRNADAPAHGPRINDPPNHLEGRQMLWIQTALHENSSPSFQPQNLEEVSELPEVQTLCDEGSCPLQEVTVKIREEAFSTVPRTSPHVPARRDIRHSSVCDTALTWFRGSEGFLHDPHLQRAGHRTSSPNTSKVPKLKHWHLQKGRNW